MAFLSLENVSLRYNKGSHLAIKDVSLTINEGEFIAVIGPSGCGKSSTVSLLSGLMSPTEGTISLNGKAITGPGTDRAVVFQDYSLFPWMTTKENIEFALKQVGTSASQAKEKALEFLKLVGLDNFSNHFPSELSGGMRQRIAIARAFALDAPIYLMDEPFGAVDAKNRFHLQDLLLRLRSDSNQSKTVLFVTHDIDEALYLADRVVVFSPGPGQIRQVVTVPFERPRKRYFLLKDPAYLALRNQLMSLLQQDILDQLEAVEGGAGI